MKKVLSTLLAIIMACSVFGQAQDTREKIEAAKIALITERLELTPDQAEKFWPVYREYSQKNRELRSSFRKVRKDFDPNTATEEENKKMLEMANSVKQQQLDLEKEYSKRVLKVITSRQLNNLRRAESDFKEMLLKRIRAQQMKRQQQRNRNDERLRQRRN